MLKICNCSQDEMTNSLTTDRLNLLTLLLFSVVIMKYHMLVNSHVMFVQS